MNSTQLSSTKAADVQHPLNTMSIAGWIVTMPWILGAAAWLLFAIGYAVIEGYDWYSSSLSTTQAVTWYAWPWSWPGPKVAEQVFIHLGHPQWHDQADDLKRIVEVIPRLFLAAAVNIFVAMVPLTAIGFVMSAWRWTRRRTGVPECTSLR